MLDVTFFPAAENEWRRTGWDREPGGSSCSSPPSHRRRSCSATRQVAGATEDASGGLPRETASCRSSRTVCTPGHGVAEGGGVSRSEITSCMCGLRLRTARPYLTARRTSCLSADRWADLFFGPEYGARPLACEGPRCADRTVRHGSVYGAGRAV